MISIAEKVAERATCERLKVGCVICKDRTIVVTGYNGAPSGSPHCSQVGCDLLVRQDGGTHCKRSLHAEVNALLQAARYGHSVDGATIYIWGCISCYDCAKCLVNAGIKRLVYTGDYHNYSVEAERITDFLTDAGVDVYSFLGTVN